MFYDNRVRTCMTFLITASLVFSFTHAGKNKTAVRPKHKRAYNWLYQKYEEERVIPKKNAQDTLYKAVCRHDTQTVRLILSSSSEIDTNKKDQLCEDTALHAAVTAQSPTLVGLLLRHKKTNPHIKDSFGKTALDWALLTGGSHRMIKTFTNRKNFDPTARDSAGKSTINKLHDRNPAWAQQLCKRVLYKKLKDKESQCMVCFDNPQELLEKAAGSKKSPGELMNITPCCHGLICTKDKQMWQKTKSTCPTCRTSWSSATESDNPSEELFLLEQMVVRIGRNWYDPSGPIVGWE